MPPLSETVNANITRIDAPFPEQWREQFSQLAEELASIKDLMGGIAISLTTSKEAQEALVELYSKESLSERASQAIAAEQSQGRLLGPDGKALEASYQETPTPPTTEQDRQEKEQPSTPPDAPDTPTTPSNILDKEITMPQHYGGKYTTQDLLVLAGKAARANTPVIGSSPEAAKAIGEAAEFAPNIEAGWNLGKTYYGQIKGPSEGFNQYAGALGSQPSGGGALGAENISGPFGLGSFRLPFVNSSSWSGIGQTLKDYGTALNVPGLSPEQVKAMNLSLAERGWQENGTLGPQGENLFNAQANLIGKGGAFQSLGENPEVADLLDHATRSGNASMKEMLKTIESIPELSENANEGMAQMVKSFSEIGEMSQSQGGTFAAGVKQAGNLAASTGIPLQASKSLLESPWTTSAIFRATGEPSWMQGTVPGAVKNQAMMKGFWSLAHAVGKGEGHSYKSEGFEKYVSPIQEQAARMHMLMPNTPPEVIMRMLREGRAGSTSEMSDRQKILGQAEDWEEKAEALMGTGHERQENQMLTASNVGQHNFGRLLHNMEGLKTPEGKRMFNQEEIKNIRTNFGSGYSGHGSELVKEKAEALQKVAAIKAGKKSNAAGSPNNVMIELSPFAKKFLELPNKRSRIKAEAGAGENSTVNGFTGATDSLLPGGVPGGIPSSFWEESGSHNGLIP